jgi:hypothetical protein
MKVVRLSALHTGSNSASNRNEYQEYFLGVKAESTPGHSRAGRIMSVKNSNDTIGNWNRNLRSCSAVLQPTVPPCASSFQAGHEVNHSLAPTAYVKTEWSYTCTPSICLHGTDSEKFTCFHLIWNHHVLLITIHKICTLLLDVYWTAY